MSKPKKHRSSQGLHKPLTQVLWPIMDDPSQDLSNHGIGIEFSHAGDLRVVIRTVVTINPRANRKVSPARSREGLILSEESITRLRELCDCDMPHVRVAAAVVLKVTETGLVKAVGREAGLTPDQVQGLVRKVRQYGPDYLLRDQRIRYPDETVRRLHQIAEEWDGTVLGEAASLLLKVHDRGQVGGVVHPGRGYSWLRNIAKQVLRSGPEYLISRFSVFALPAQTVEQVRELAESNEDVRVREIAGLLLKAIELRSITAALEGTDHSYMFLYTIAKQVRRNGPEHLTRRFTNPIPPEWVPRLREIAAEAPETTAAEVARMLLVVAETGSISAAVAGTSRRYDWLYHCIQEMRRQGLEYLLRRRRW